MFPVLTDFDIDFEATAKLKQPAATQGLISNETSGGQERLAKLWYIPHVTEILLGMIRPDKQNKGAFDFQAVIFRNSQTYLRSTRVHGLIADLLHVVTVMATVLHKNKRFTASVGDVRMADYVVSTINLVKREFQAQGENAEYSRVLRGLTYRWQFWTMKWKYILAVSIHGLDYKMV